MRGAGLAGVLATLAVIGCSDALEQTTPVGQEILVLDGPAALLKPVNAGDFTAGLSFLLAFPVPGAPRIAGRGPLVVVPGGTHDSVQVVSLGGGVAVVPVPGHPVGAAFQDDTLAWVADSSVDSITQLNARTGQEVASRSVGPGPVALAVTDSQVFSVHSTWLTAMRLAGAPNPDSIPLSGSDAHFALVGDDSLLYVIERGDSGKANGRISIVDPAARQELVVINGLGERPGPGVFHPTGRILIASPTDGILEVSSLTRTVTRGPGNGIEPGGKGVLGIALDNRGRVYAVSNTGCGSALGTLYILAPPPDYTIISTVALGTCPVAATVAEMPTQ